MEGAVQFLPIEPAQFSNGVLFCVDPVGAFLASFELPQEDLI